MKKKATENNCHVHGVVTNANGGKVSHATVTLWWQRIRERKRLARGRSSQEGQYSLRCQLPDDAPGKILLVVEADGGGLSAPLKSPQTSATPDLSINLAAAPADPSQYGTLLAAITPLLQGLSLLDVVQIDEHQDISFLATETGAPARTAGRVIPLKHPDFVSPASRVLKKSTSGFVFHWLGHREKPMSSVE